MTITDYLIFNLSWNHWWPATFCCSRPPKDAISDERRKTYFHHLNPSIEDLGAFQKKVDEAKRKKKKQMKLPVIYFVSSANASPLLVCPSCALGWWIKISYKKHIAWFKSFRAFMCKFKCLLYNSGPYRLMKADVGNFLKYIQSIWNLTLMLLWNKME